MPNVGFVREEVRDKLHEYELIEDCLAGEHRIKSRRYTYLPMIDPTDASEANRRRNDVYRQRAVFFGTAEKTLSDLVGQIFMREPEFTVPTLLNSVVDDATGTGIPLKQVGQEMSALAVSFGRLGLYADFPAPASEVQGDVQGEPEGISIAEIESGDIRPTLRVIRPRDLLNYRVKARGAKIILSLVVFREDRIVEDDGFETKTKDQWRALRLDENDEYVIEVYYNRQAPAPDEVYRPKDAQGNPLREIPFTFVGSLNNEPKPNPAPFYQLCSLNIHHYMNSADYEESIFVTGQPTVAAAGLTEEWVEKVLGGVLTMGSRGGIPLPAGASVELLQALPNTLAKEGMDQKEDQMQALGAKFRSPDQVTRTATESDIDNVAETSTLSRVAQNVQAALEKALGWCAAFAGATGQIKVKMNTEFDLVNLTPQEVQQIIASWNAGAITFEEMRTALRRGGIAYLPDAKAKTDIEAEQAAMAQIDVNIAAAMAEAVPQTNAPVA